MPDKKINAYLVAAGMYHDIDFARQEILKLLLEHPNIRTKVAADYHDIEGIQASDFLITYTCNLMPSEDEQKALVEYIKGGGKWFALHGTNSILEFTENGVDAPETAPIVMDLLGSQFMAHPPIQLFTVKTEAMGHELVKDVGEFETDDEQYLCKMHGEHELLMYSEYSGTCDGWIHSDFNNDDKRAVYYIKKTGDGEVLYLNLGHCRGHWDMEPVAEYYPEIEKGSWDRPQYYELLRRGIKYCAGI
ncbi:MAG: ThuA domain-containing protein [Pseudomonadales bacterium]|nr:ThuA domain-containing protein [Pseudomonadales bacterium]MBO6566939.1 ThuA domain-containing protein [Pseudomonadales bacterium]MBO6595478.1 ThuA domain-containing protein [Pseudomonadales bacterium]MBO6701978.1 ThuA domain-containing protein [Pseudomonadales bacterium]MBO6820963.1 ThuA domain-containing protein [Pseudomonadales bacterium]